MGAKGSRRYAATILFLATLVFLYIVVLERSGSSSCSCDDRAQGKFMWYAPHSGFSNQVGELRNAMRVAAILDRVLVLPPVTDHHTLSLGSCPKYRIVEPSQLRAAALSHFSDLVHQSRYYSIADIVNISAVSPRFVRAIDFRVFALMWCGADIRPSCAGPLCHELASSLSRVKGIAECGEMLASQGTECSSCAYSVDDTCATTVWTYRRKRKSRRLVENLPNLPVKIKTKKYEGGFRVKRDIYRSLGSNKAKVLAFGSLFSADYQGEQTHVEFTSASGDEKFDQMFQASEYLPLSQEIIRAGKTYIERRMNAHSFFCVQLRLLDGQFKNHWRKTFASLKSRLESLKTETVLPIFLMTDLPRANWSGTYLGQLATSKSYKLHVLDGQDELVADTARKILLSEVGIKSGIIPYGVEARGQRSIMVADQIRPEVLLYVQEAICSCASLGFQGTAGSTISQSIIQLRNAGC